MMLPRLLLVVPLQEPPKQGAVFRKARLQKIVTRISGFDAKNSALSYLRGRLRVGW